MRRVCPSCESRPVKTKLDFSININELHSRLQGQEAACEPAERPRQSRVWNCHIRSPRFESARPPAFFRLFCPRAPKSSVANESEQTRKGGRIALCTSLAR